MRDRGFRPTLGVDRLESRRLLDGSGVVGPPPIGPMPGMPDQEIIDLENQIQQIESSGMGMASISIPAMTMANLADEIKAINDLRDSFNTVVDSVIATDTNEVKHLSDFSTLITAHIAALDPAVPDDQAKLPALTAVRAQTVADIAAAQARQDAMTKFKATVNTMVDEIIANIRFSTYVVMDTTFTQYDSDAYAAAA